MTPHVRRFRVPLYGPTLYLAYADSLYDANRALPSACDGLFDADTLGGGAAAVTTSCEEEGIIAILFVRKHLTASTVAHEALHATLGIMKVAGVGPMYDSNEEAYAYVLSWIVDVAVREWNRGGRKSTQTKGKTNDR